MEMEKSKNLYVRPMDMNYRGRGGMRVGRGAQGGGNKGEKRDNCDSVMNKMYF